MEIIDNKIIITDENIVNFYTTNKNIDFISMNHIFIKIIQDLSVDLNKNLINSQQSQILNIVNEIKTNINSLRSDMVIKLIENKKDYIEDIKTLLNNNSLTMNEKINNILEKGNDMLLIKTQNIINEIIPKEQNKYNTELQNYIKPFFDIIKSDTEKLKDNINKDETIFKNYIEKIDNTFNNMINSINQPIFNFINSSEKRTTETLKELTEDIRKQYQEQNTLKSDLTTFLNKYKNNSSVKGAISENELYFILQKVFPSDDIKRCSSETASCDFKVIRKDTSKPTILFENKDYENKRSVDTEEVKKFERDLQKQKCHGIFLSQNSPITFKDNFEIEIINNLIHLYIPNCNYSVEKIILATNIIDELNEQLKKITNIKEANSDISITQEDMEDLLNEYKGFISQKLELITLFTSFYNDFTEKIKKIDLPCLNNIISKNGFGDVNGKFSCECGWTSKNKTLASLSAHKRRCTYLKNNMNDNTTNTENIVVKI